MRERACGLVEVFWVENFAGVQNVVRVKDLLDLPLQLGLTLTQLVNQPLSLQQPDTVFAGEGAAKGDCFAKDCFGSIPDVLWHIFFVVKEIGVKVAIAGVSNGRNQNSILRLNIAQGLQHFAHL